MQPKRVLIYGEGQLGSAYRDYFRARGTNVINTRIDIRDAALVASAVREAKPDLVINCVAKADIDWCERNRMEAFEVNVLGADHIAQAAQDAGAYLVHISSGCVQESLTAADVHTEDDPPHPLCYYSWTKVWAENLLLERGRRQGLKALVLRPRQLLSAKLSPRNALVKMLTYTKFIDTPNSCTVIEDLLWVTDELVRKDAVGLINITNPGVTTPHRIAELLKLHVRPEMVFSKMSKDELNRMTFAKRIDAVLSTDRLASYGITLKPLEERLVEVLADLKKNLAGADAAAVMARTAEDTKNKLLVTQ
ncbi:sugar nucleotide-binding protein [Candidatus Uhrbacteria bacterium]|nr:sugar nucleotide-binding protein [Candidatus Uhrbacteria bacterium]